MLASFNTCLFAISFCLLLCLGLVNALNLIKDIKEKYSGITYADLFQLASTTAIEVRLNNSKSTFTGFENICLSFGIFRKLEDLKYL